jgi:phage gpG-like protein
MRLELTIDDGGLGRALAAAAARGDDLKAPLEASAVVIEGNIDARFDAGSGPGGIPWPISHRARVQGGKTMVDRAHLRQSITHQVGDKEVEVGVGVNAGGNVARKAAALQFGAHVTPKKGPFLIFTGADGGLVFARSVDIPARPYIGFDDQDVSDLEDLWLDVVSEPFRGH